MKKMSIPYAETGYFSKIISDYLNGDASLGPFYEHKPDIASVKNALEEKKKETIDRDLLVAVLQEQYKDLEISEPVKANIDAFKNENTYCVVTAHQLNIFTGPLYVIYKTLSTINACKKLKKLYPENHFVPVFWLGSEDHDFEEINHIHVFGKTISWEDRQGGACGRYKPATIKPALDELKALLGDSEDARYIIGLFSDAYLRMPALGYSVIYYMNALFGSYGLVTINGDDAALKRCCSDIIENELTEQTAYKIVNSTLREFPYEAQAKPREINLFFLQENSRERIIWQADKSVFSIHSTGIVFTKEEMLTELSVHPENFSPNVILRPLFQQRVLPAVAFIGGGGEIAYWLQLKELFHHHGIAYPVLLLRNSFLLIDSVYVSKLDKLSIEPVEIFQKEDVLVNNFIKKNSVNSISLADKKITLGKQYDAIRDQVMAVDATLEKSVLAEKQNALNAIDRIEGKLLKAEKQNLDTSIQKIRTIKNKLFPGGGLQERHENFTPFYSKYGPEFMSKIAAQADVFDFNFLILSDI